VSKKYKIYCLLYIYKMC